MSIITRMRKGTAVYWAASAMDGFGNQTFANAVEISVRWEDSQILFKDNEGRELQARSIVYVGQDMAVGDYLCNCALADLTAPTVNPQAVKGALKIINFSKLPNLRYSEYLRTCYL